MSSQYTSELQSNVYLIRLGQTNYFKIGVSRDVQSRLDALQTANPIDLTVVASFEQENARTVEMDLHRILAQVRIRREWFECDYEEIVRVFNAVNTMAHIDTALGDLPDTEEVLELPQPPTLSKLDEREDRIVLYMRWRSERIIRDTARVMRQANGEGLDDKEWAEAGKRLGVN